MEIEAVCTPALQQQVQPQQQPFIVVPPQQQVQAQPQQQATVGQGQAMVIGQPVMTQQQPGQPVMMQQPV